MTDRADTPNDPTKRVARDVLVGLVVAYLVTVGICLVGLHGDLKIALIGSLLPALFAGPFIGILLALRSYMAAEADGHDH